MKYFLSISLFFLFSLNLTSQDLDEVFDDGGLSNMKNNVYFSANDLVEGFISFGYTRYIGSRTAIGLSLGVYIIDGYSLHLPNNNNSIFHEGGFDSGFRFHFKLRRYLYDYDGFYWQYGYLFQKNVLLNTDFTLSSVPEMKFGYRWNFFQRLSLSASVGFGFGFYSIKSSALKSSIWNVSNIEWYIPLNVEFAYDF
jgi:hypothetical protein